MLAANELLGPDGCFFQVSQRQNSRQACASNFSERAIP